MCRRRPATKYVAQVLACLALCSGAQLCPGPAAGALYDAPPVGCAAWRNCTARACRVGLNDTQLLNVSSLADCLRGRLTPLVDTCATLSTRLASYVECLDSAALAGACQLSLLNESLGEDSFATLGTALVASRHQYPGSLVQVSCEAVVCSSTAATLGVGEGCLESLLAGPNASLLLCKAHSDAAAPPRPAAARSAVFVVGVVLLLAAFGIAGMCLRQTRCGCSTGLSAPVTPRSDSPPGVSPSQSPPASDYVPLAPHPSGARHPTSADAPHQDAHSPSRHPPPERL